MNRYSGISALAPVVQQTEGVSKKNIPPDQVVRSCFRLADQPLPVLWLTVCRLKRLLNV